MHDARHIYDYACPRMRTSTRWYLSVILLAIISAGAVVTHMPWLRRQVATLHLQHQCARWVYGQDTVVYMNAHPDNANNAASESSLVLAPSVWGGSAWVRMPPKCVRELASLLEVDLSRDAILFVGKRTSPGGVVRIVIVTRPNPGTYDSYVGLVRATVVTPATLFRPARVRQELRTPDCAYGTVIGPSHVLRFFGGQRDPQDPSRLTIRYACDGQDGAMVGQLRDDGSLSIGFHDGPGYMSSSDATLPCRP